MPNNTNLIEVIKLEHEAKKKTYTVQLTIFIALLTIIMTVLINSSPNFLSSVIVSMGAILFVFLVITKTLNPTVKEANTLQRVLNNLYSYQEKGERNKKTEINKLWDLIVNPPKNLKKEERKEYYKQLRIISEKLN